MKNRIQEMAELGIDQDIAEEVSGMTSEQLRGELARMEREEESSILEEESKEITNRARELTAKPESVLTLTGQGTLDGLIKAGSSPDKALNWLIAQRKTGLDTNDLEPREAVSSQHLLPDKVYQEEAAKQLKNEYLNKAITDNPELPTSLIEELYHCQSKASAQMLLRKYELDTIAEAKDEGMRFILEQSQSFDLPAKLRARIAGLSVKNITEARAEVSELVRNFRR